MIKLANVSKYYNSNGIINLALQDINLTFNKGEIVAITGESGSGKSTLLNVICGVDSYNEGEIYFNGEETSYFNQDDMDNFRQKNVSFIYQNYNVIDSYTVLENVMVPLMLRGYSEKEARTRAKELIEKVKLGHRIKSKAVNLSGGEKQRTVIARALACDCPILACDEITGNLDSKTGDEIISLIKEVSKDKLVLMVTHNIEQCECIITRKIVLADGKVMEDSDVHHDDEIYEEKALAKTRDKDFRPLAFIVKSNLKNTPRKTFFSTLLLFVLSFLVTFLMSVGSFVNGTLFMSNASAYTNRFDDRVIVYNQDHSPMNKSDFSSYDQSRVIYNSMIEGVTSYIHSPMKGYYASGNLSCYVDKEVNLYAGSLPESDNDVLIVANSKNDVTFDDFKIGDKVNLGANGLNTPQVSLKICGFAYSNKVDRLFVVSRDVYERLNESFLKYALTNYYGVYVGLDLAETKADYMTQFDNVIDPLVKVVSNTSSVNVSYVDVTILDIYRVRFDTVDVDVITDNTMSGPSIKSVTLPSDYLVDDIFEITVYPQNVSSFVREIESKGYKCAIPAENYTGNVVVDAINGTYTFISVASGFVVSLVAYVAISRVYGYKIKEFAVLRSQGFLKSSMAKIIHLEITLMGLVSFALSVVTIPLVGLRNELFAEISKYISLPIVLVSFLIVLALSNFIAHRLNKRIFKNSLFNILKLEEDRR